MAKNIEYTEETAIHIIGSSSSSSNDYRDCRVLIYDGVNVQVDSFNYFSNNLMAKVFYIVWAIVMIVVVFAFGILVGLTANIETEPKCIEIPEDKMIVITRSEVLLETLEEK